jgi:exopolysaccharide production protein ExoZ
VRFWQARSFRFISISWDINPCSDWSLQRMRRGLLRRFDAVWHVVDSSGAALHTPAARSPLFTPPNLTNAMSIETFGTSSDAKRAGPRRVENVQALRGIASLMVVVYHIGLIEAALFGKSALLPKWTSSWNSGVDLFFVISGFVMVTISTHRFHNPGGSRTFFLRRMARIYPLYWCFTLICLALVFWKADCLYYIDKPSLAKFLTSLFLIPDVQYPFLTPGWTLIHELYFYLCFALILKSSERGRMILVSVWSLLIIVFNLPVANISNISPFLAIATNALTLEFVAGCAIAWIINSGVSKLAGPALVLSVIGFVLAPAMHAPHVARYLIPTALLTYGAIAIEMRHGFNFPVWLRRLGDYSYSLYLSHLITASLVADLLFHFRRNTLDDILFIVASIVFAVAVSAASYYGLEKPLLAGAYTVVQRYHPSGRINSGPPGRENL